MVLPVLTETLVMMTSYIAEILKVKCFILKFYSRSYPILLDENIDFMMNDENLLLIRLKTLGIKIDYKTQYRPIFGIHISVNRKKVEGYKSKFNWGASGKRVLWKKFKATERYKFIYPLLDKYLIKKLQLLEAYYQNHE